MGSSATAVGATSVGAGAGAAQPAAHSTTRMKNTMRKLLCVNMASVSFGARAGHPCTCAPTHSDDMQPLGEVLPRGKSAGGSKGIGRRMEINVSTGRGIRDSKRLATTTGNGERVGWLVYRDPPVEVTCRVKCNRKAQCSSTG